MHVVRHKVLVEGRSQRAVARELGLARVTVRKYLEEAVPVRKETAPRARPVWDVVGPRVEALLAESAQWTGGKQQLTATRLHELLVAEGHRVGVTLVKEAVAEWKRQRREVFVPLTYRPGDLAEVDFFEVLVDLDGTRRKAWLFLMRLMYSGRDFAWIYERQDQISFLDGHVRAFAHFEGVPGRIAYDNLRAAVVRILVGGERALTARFAALASHYLVEPCFCRPGEGHDKGGVEARGKALRRQALVPIPQRARPWTAINEALLARMDARLEMGRDVAGHTIGARFAEETPHFRSLPPPFVAEATTISTVSPRALVRLRRRRVLGAVSVGGAGSDRAHRRDDCHHRRPRRHAHRASAQALRPAVDRLSPLPAGAGAQAASRPPSAARVAARSRGAVSGGLGSFPRGPCRRARPRGSLPRCSGSSTRTASRSSCPRWKPRSRTGTPLLLALTPGPAAPVAARVRSAPGGAARSRRAEWLRRRLRRLAGGGRMSAAAVTRDLVVAHTRALKLPGVARPLRAWRGKRATRTGRTKTICMKSSARSWPRAMSP